MRRLSCLLATSVVLAVSLIGLAQLPLISGGSTAQNASAASPPQQIGMKVLLITDTTGEASYQDWENTLRREGVPFDSVVTSSNATLPTLSTTLSGGTQVANYEGVVVATSGLEGLSPAQWTTLQTFEHQFSVRQLTAYAYPSSDYGLTTPPSGIALPGSTPLALSADGAKVFPYLNSVALDTTGTFGYEAKPLAGANVDTLISSPGSSSLVGIYTTPDGRQTMFQTFDENQYMLQSELLRHGELAWLTRNTYFGDQRNYLETDIDDNFLSDDSWSVAGNATTAAHSTDFDPADALREVPADVTTAANWARANNFRIDMLFNGGGSVQWAAGCTEAAGGDNGTTGTTTGCSSSAPGTDPLLAQFQATDPATGRPFTQDFGWISHTWDHPNIDEGCATQDYIEAELNQNTTWGTKAAGTAGDPNGGGLGLTGSTDPTAALGNDNPQVIVTGEHSGLPNLIPGNPGQVDPPSLDDATAATTGGSLAAGEYVYAVSDQFNTAAPGTTPIPGVGESAGSVSAPVTVTGTTGTVTLTWSAVCHAAGYIVYRAPYTAPVAPATAGTIGAWSQVGTVAANTATDFTNPTGNSTTDTAGGGAVEKTFTDTGTEATTSAPAGEPQTDGTAAESAYEQNPALDAAFAGVLDGGIKYFGADASKPYPNPAGGSFSTGAFAGAATEFPAGATFQDAGATAIPRYPTNIYYNVSTNAQEVDEYQTLYDSPTCTPIAGVTTCNPAGTTFTIAQIAASVDQGMFQHMMGNDPRPEYFHQTNLMSSTSGGTTGDGDGLFYETLNPLLAQYHQYFAANAPIEQLTMAQIGTLLSEQAGWATAAGTQVSGNIDGNVVTVNNNGAAIELPLTGTTVGSAYAGSQSGWTLAPTGTSSYTALSAWPAPPTAPVTVTVPKGPSPGTGGKLPGPAPKPEQPGANRRAPRGPVYQAVQVAPTKVRVSGGGNVTVSLKCQAPKRKSCVGKFTLRVSGQNASHAFSIKSGKVAHIVVRLPKKAGAAARKHGRTLHATLSISTKQPGSRRTRVTRGKLTIKT